MNPLRRLAQHGQSAWLDGIRRSLVAGGGERFAAEVGEPSRLGSVASFFVSRIDSAVDARLEARLTRTTDADERARLRRLLGSVAVASARLVYQSYKAIFSGERWEALAARGARTQRLLWASTGARGPACRDTRYVEELIGPETVTTMPPSTWEAFRHHGCPRPGLEEGLDGARQTLDTLEGAGISLSAVADELLADGVRRFAEAFERVLGAVQEGRARARRPAPSSPRGALDGNPGGEG
jgi:transaldolase/glucose-6-phosphate isomerase